MDVGVACDNPKRFRWLRRLFYPLDAWLDHYLWFPLSNITRKYTESRHFNRFVAGISEFAWVKTCGYGWKFAAHCAGIYWGWVKVDPGPPPEKAE